jgi:hypothetical protein
VEKEVIFDIDADMALTDAGFKKDQVTGHDRLFRHRPANPGLLPDSSRQIFAKQIPVGHLDKA